jgi:uncharacterized membrane protein
MSRANQPKNTHRKRPRGGIISILTATAIVWYIVLPFLALVGMILGVVAVLAGGFTLLFISWVFLGAGIVYIVYRVFKETPELIGGIVKSVKEEIEEYLDYAGVLNREGDGNGEE